MDIFNLNEKVEGLVSYLQETGYSAMYMRMDYYPMVANTTASLTTMSCSAQNTRM